MYGAKAPGSSTVVDRLVHASAQGERAFESTWAEVVGGGLPAIEAEPGRPGHRRVTFLWRPSEAPSGALVTSPLFQPDPENLPMHPLGTTGVWYRTVVLDARLRGSYGFVPFGDPPPDPGRSLDLHVFRTLVPDPHHPERVRFPAIVGDPEDRDLERSVLELPEAAAQPYVQPRAGTPRGKLEALRFEAPGLDGAHPVWVYSSPGTSAGDAPKDLLLLFDGLAYLHVVPTPTILDNLRAEGRIDPVVAVFWDYPRGELRNRELECNSEFAQMIVHRFLPWLQDRYPIAPSPDRRAVGGGSAGGLGATYIAVRYPDAFGKVLSQSGWFSCRPEGPGPGRGQIFRTVRESPRGDVRFYLEAGTQETGPEPYDLEILPNNRLFRDLLLERGYPVSYSEYFGGHDHVQWRGTLASGICALLPPQAPSNTS